MFTILRIDAHATADRMPTEYAALAASGRTDVVLNKPMPKRRNSLLLRRRKQMFC